MIIAGIVAATFILWLFAAACIPHLENKDQAPAWRKLLCEIGYLYDLGYDTLVGRFLFWEPTSQIGTLTRRLKRNKNSDGWRGKEAAFFCWLISLIRGGAGHCE